MVPIYSGKHKANSVEELSRLCLHDSPKTEKEKEKKKKYRYYTASRV